ncbi:MAG: prolipoprotein diacylglyceryl transferase [Deltaproteobacteria bacterium]|nr:prolipoprotein diacylglyceryl transferase [Deltaproteobacteria bacterium]
MKPFLFNFYIFGQHIRIPTYGFLLATAFSTGYLLTLKRAIKENISTKHIENFFLIAVLSSIFGARLFHVLFEEFSYYSRHPEKVFALWEGGYTFYGALLSSFFFMWLYTRWQKLSFLEMMDLCCPGGALGLFIGRLGCFFAGCCWGSPSSLPWAVAFNAPESLSSSGNVRVHPTQVYEALIGLVLFFYLTWRFKNRKYVGQIFLQTITFYSLGRFGIEFFRGDEYRGYLFNGLISYSQFVSLAILPFTISGMYRFSKKSS